MTAIIKNRFRIQNAKDFLENLTSHPRTVALPSTISLLGATEDDRVEELQLEIGSHVVNRNLYLFVGKSRPWTDELSPPLPQDSNFEEFRIWDGILGLKKIQDSSGSLVIPRFNWDGSGQTIYKPYDDQDSDLLNHPTTAEIADGELNGYTAGPIYILTDEYHIFKCLGNNNNSKSTVKPTKPLTAPFIFEGADGYKWKYMASVSPGQVVKFLTDRWIPVRTLKEDDGTTQWLVQDSAVDGSVESCIIDNKGSGYVNTDSGVLVSATVSTAVLAASASVVDDVYVGSQIHIISGLGAGEIRDISDYDGITKTITISSSWTVDSTSEYEILPKLVISGNGVGALAKPIISGGEIIAISIIDGGTNYRFAEASITGGGGAGAIIRPVLSSPGGHGSDIEKELGAFFVMLNARLQYEEGAGDFPISNDYRQIGLIRDLKNLDGTIATADTRVGIKKLNVTGIVSGPGGSFTPDENVTGTLGLDSASALVVDFVSTGPTTGTISILQDSVSGYNSFLDGMTLLGSISGASATVDVTGVVQEEIKKFDGEILYVENRRPVLRAPDQIEDIKAIIEF